MTDVPNRLPAPEMVSENPADDVFVDLDAEDMHKPAMMRSDVRRLGARFRPR